MSMLIIIYLLASSVSKIVLQFSSQSSNISSSILLVILNFLCQSSLKSNLKVWLCHSFWSTGFPLLKHIFLMNCVLSCYMHCFKCIQTQAFKITFLLFQFSFFQIYSKPKFHFHTTHTTCYVPYRLQSMYPFKFFFSIFVLHTHFEN
jgi:hypothetical protein